jgi:hypothetical protein
MRRGIAGAQEGEVGRGIQRDRDGAERREGVAVDAARRDDVDTGGPAT